MIQQMFKCTFKVHWQLIRELKNQIKRWSGQWPPDLYGDLYSGHDEVSALKCPGVDKSPPNRAQVLRERGFPFIIDTWGTHHNTLFLQTEWGKRVIIIISFIKY